MIFPFASFWGFPFASTFAVCRLRLETAKGNQFKQHIIKDVQRRFFRSMDVHAQETLKKKTSGAWTSMLKKHSKRLTTTVKYQGCGGQHIRTARVLRSQLQVAVTQLLDIRIRIDLHQRIEARDKEISLCLGAQGVIGVVPVESNRINILSIHKHKSTQHLQKLT